MTETVDRPRTGTPPRRPGPRLPDVPGPLETLALAWRRLRRMSTALLLLFALAACSIVATVIPQEPVTAQTVEEWRTGVAGPGEAVARVMETMGLFDVFGSWWFATLTALLFVSLTGCLIPRYAAFAKVVRRPPAAGRNLGRLTHHEEFASDLEPAAVLAAAEPVLRARRFRGRELESPEHAAALQFAAERGHWREGGSLLFHTAFYLLLTGAVVGQAFGFVGQVGLVEGGAFADTRISYDYVEPGRYFGLDDHRGFVATLDDFEVGYFDNFVPRDFVSTVTFSEPGQPPRTEQIRVNHPIEHNGMTLYQTDFGFAPRLRISAGERVLFDEQVLLSPVDGQNSWSGTAKVRFDDPQNQLALDLVLVPDARLGADGQPVIGPDPRPRNPVMVGSLYFGALGLERPVPASRFDRSAGPVDTAMLRPGTSSDLVEGNLTVELVDVAYWSGFQVAHQPGRMILLAGAALVLIGLIPSLYSYRRRVWVEARPADGGSRVTVAGVALQRKAAFADEYQAIADAVRSGLGPHRKRST